MTLYRCQQYDVLDLICKQHYGEEAHYTEAVYAANPGLADRGSHLQIGLVIHLPEIQFAPENDEMSLWD